MLSVRKSIYRFWKCYTNVYLARGSCIYRKLDDYFSFHKRHSDELGKNFDNLTDASLAFAAVPGHRTIGQVAWHLVQSVASMGNEVKLGLDAGPLAQPVPASASEIAAAYRAAHAGLAAAIRAQWTDAGLTVEDEMYGERWTRGFILFALLGHEVHHHGQLTVLMRLAGLEVFGVYGPSKEEWAQYGMKQPAGLA